MVDSASAPHCFSADNVSLKFGGNLEVPLHRVPGAMAALHQEMAEPWLPSAVEIQASQDSERVEISFPARAAAQFITADPAVRGYGFIHEIVGEYKCRGELHGIPFETNGCAVFEYVI
jgi:hypothetical protein